MLDAAEVILARPGLQGATLPRIAAEAEIAPANVYRRFRDKDALMAAVFERLRNRSATATAAAVDPGPCGRSAWFGFRTTSSREWSEAFARMRV